MAYVKCERCRYLTDEITKGCSENDNLYLPLGFARNPKWGPEFNMLEIYTYLNAKVNKKCIAHPRWGLECPLPRLHWPMSTGKSTHDVANFLKPTLAGK